jgi:peptide/nickel transport system substrate-binding protein
VRAAGLLATAGALLVAGALASCGGGAEPTDAKVTISQSAAPDSLDPAVASKVGSLEAVWLAYTPLLTYRRDEGQQGAELIAGLAGDLPEVSADGLTYTLTLRKDLAYSDGSPVRAGDFEHTVQRVLTLDSPGAPMYEAIAGARRYEQSGDRGADIAGIEADDQTGAITIRLGEPDSSFPSTLALTYGGLVPSKTPFRDMTGDPPPGVGPYELSAPDATGGFELSKSPNFADLDIPDIPTGNLATIAVKTVPGRRAQAEQVLDGRLDFMHDEPPATIRAGLLDPPSDRYAEHPIASTSYFFLDDRTAPFDDPLVREAVNRGVDRGELVRLGSDPGQGDRLQPGCSVLPPGVPGYDPGLDGADCPYGDPTGPPDVAGAEALIRRANATGARVDVWGSDRPAAAAVTRAYARTLTRIGLDARVRLAGAAAYEAMLGRPAREPQTGYVTRTAAVLDPGAFLAELEPATIAGPDLDASIARLGAVGTPGFDEDGWRELNRRLSSPPQSGIVAIGHGQAATFFSERLDPSAAVFHPLFRDDYSSWRLSAGG